MFTIKFLDEKFSVNLFSLWGAYLVIKNSVAIFKNNVPDILKEIKQIQWDFLLNESTIKGGFLYYSFVNYIQLIS